MNIIEAVKSGKPFKRPGDVNWSSPDAAIEVMPHEILATDWEILDTWNVDTTYRSSGVEL